MTLWKRLRAYRARKKATNGKGVEIDIEFTGDGISPSGYAKPLYSFSTGPDADLSNLVIDGKKARVVNVKGVDYIELDP